MALRFTLLSFRGSTQVRSSSVSSTMIADTGSPQYIKEQNCIMSVQQFRAFQNTRANLFWAIKMSKGQSDDHGKLKLDHLMNKARKLWDNRLQSVKNFLWNRALGNFVQLILDFIPAVVKSYVYPYWQFPSLVRY